MPEQPTLPQVHGVRMRVCRLDSNGVPTPGANNLYVSECFTKVSISPVYTAGSEIEEKNAQGVVCVNYIGADTFKRADIQIEMCSPDPYLSALLSGGTVLTDGGKTGWAPPALGAVPLTTSLSIEVWSRRIDDGELDADSPFGWWVYPRVRNLKVEGWEHGDSALLPMFSGQAYENPNWLDGPLNDWPVDSTKVFQYMPTTYATLPSPSASGLETVAAS